MRDVAYTNSADEVAPLYTSLDTSAAADTWVPGAYPFTRGIHPTGYRGKLWTMRQFAGFSTARETNERFKFLLSQGQTGLSVAFDFPTLMGYDSDHPRSEGEVGKCGVAISSLADMETLMEGIPLGRVSTSMTINGAGDHPLLLLRRGRREAGRAARRGPGHGSERHPQGVHGAARVDATRSSPRCA